MIKRLFSFPLTWFLVFSFFVMSWPFVFFPLTDGDIVNWAQVSAEFRNTGQFLVGGNDQGHGPLMAWTGAIFTSVFKHSFYWLNFFNLLMSLLGTYLVYTFSARIWKRPEVSSLATFLYSTSLVTMYLAKTPMYDWPAAILFFSFCGWYWLFVEEGNVGYLCLALVSVGIGSLSRFSILLGLSGFFVIGATFVYKRSFLSMVRDGLLVLGAVALANFPWLWGQLTAHGDSFLKTFLYDNTGRYVKSTRPDAVVRRDYYGFPLYVLVGMLPHTFCLVASFFRREFIDRVKENKSYQMCLLAILPCLILFSFSGHTKLARYIAYVFPPIMMLLAHNLALFDLANPRFRNACKKMMFGTVVVLAVLLGIQVVQFSSEVQEGMLFSISVVVFLFSLIFVTYFLVAKRYSELATQSHRFLWMYSIVYGAFFTVLAYESVHAPFLKGVREGILRAIW
ncbi:MAG: 4-amino-4-deoxy-L-arabinose transferase-like glycosyltransferase [Candidatus Marinamargulisbacteria bacterium]|jgi:4-amino-4-deoxy-L-arabinose transferase-like glycosyltransferase